MLLAFQQVVGQLLYAFQLATAIIRVKEKNENGVFSYGSALESSSQIQVLNFAGPKSFASIIKTMTLQKRNVSLWPFIL